MPLIQVNLMYVAIFLVFTGVLILLTEFYFEYKEVFPQYCDLVETVRKGKKEEQTL